MCLVALAFGRNHEEIGFYFVPPTYPPLEEEAVSIGSIRKAVAVDEYCSCRGRFQWSSNLLFARK